MDSKMKWNHKYQTLLNEQKKPDPNKRLQSLTPYLNGGVALDIACGLGGNSLLLAQNHYRVHAIDISDRFKLHSKELLREFIDWKILFYEENEYEGRQTIFCQKHN